MTAIPSAARAPASPSSKRTARSGPQACLAIIVLTWLATVILHKTNLGGEWDPVSLTTWGWLSFWLAALVSGYLLSGAVRNTGSQARPQTQVPVHLNAWMIVLCGVAAVGVGLFIFDFAILRGYGFSTAAAAIRAEEVNEAISGTTQSSVYSGLGRLLIPAILPTTILAILFWKRLKPGTIAFFLFTATLILLQQVLFEGGRFFIAATAASTVTAYLLFPRMSGQSRHRPFRKKGVPIIRLTVLLLVLLSFFSYVFIERILERGGYFATAYLQFCSSFEITPNYSQMGLFEGPLGGLWFSVCMLWMYATQGFNELDLILQQPYLEHAYGLYQFPQVGQAITLLTGIDVRYDALANLPTYGSYATFYGHSYVDFGNAGSIAFAIALGYLAGRSINAFWRGRLNAVSMSGPILFIVCVLSPVISLFPTIWPAIAWSIAIGAVIRTRAI